MPPLAAYAVVLALLLWIALRLEWLNQTREHQQEDLMATIDDFNTLLTAMNDATNAVAADIQALKDQLAAGGLTAAEEADVQTRLGEAVTRLQALGADPGNPVP